MYRVTARVFCASMGEVDLSSIMEDVLFEMKQRANKAGNQVNVGEVHLRAHELLYEKQNGKKPPSLSNCFAVIIPQTPLSGCRQISLQKYDFPGFKNNMMEISSEELLRLFHASDEYMYYEVLLMRYLRENQLDLIRSLPLLREAWCHIFSGIRNAEERFISARKEPFASWDISPEWYKKIEDRIDYVHKFTLAAHRALFLSSPQQLCDSVEEPFQKILSIGPNEFLAYIENLKKVRKEILLELF